MEDRWARLEAHGWRVGSAAEFLEEPVLTCRAIGTTVVPKDHQRFER